MQDALQSCGRDLVSCFPLLQIRNGLGQFGMGQKSFTHAFDGYAKLCSWTFVGGDEVRFNSRFVKTNFFRASKARDDVAPYLLFQSTVPGFSVWEKVHALLHGIDNTNTNVKKYHKRRSDRKGRTADYLALSDFWHSYAFNPETLRTRGRVMPRVPGGTPFGSTLPLPSSSHPVAEFNSSNHISYVSIMNPLPLGENSIRVIRIKSARVRQMIAKIRVSQVPYMHSFGLSPNHAIVFAAPLYVNIARLMRNAEPVNSLDWLPDEAMKVYVVNIHTGEVRTFVTEAVFPMHNINSYEPQSGVIVADAVAYPDIAFMKALEMDTLANRTARNLIPTDSRVTRFTIDLNEGTIRQSFFETSPSLKYIDHLDMPNINEKYRHRKYCYVYGLSLRSDGVNLSNTTIVKKNVCEAGRDAAWYELNHYPTEPWFEARPGAQSEDDGILLSLVLDGEKRASYLGMWDAKTLRLINRCYVPKRIPFTLHGEFFPAH